MMYITNELEQMVVLELLAQVVAETDVAHLRSYIVRIGNYTPAMHSGTCIVYSGGIAPTVRENHGMVTAVNVRVE